MTPSTLEASQVCNKNNVMKFMNPMQVVLVFDNGPMREILEYSNGGQLCDGNWHSLLISKNGLAGTISVDGNTPQTVVSSCDICQSFFAVNTDDPFYVGGIPGLQHNSCSIYMYMHSPSILNI
jgi:hypothetical protein